MNIVVLKINFGLKEIECGDIHLIHLAQIGSKSYDVADMVTNIRFKIQGREFLVLMSGSVLKMGCAST